MHLGRCVGGTEQTKRSLTQAAKLGGPISERIGMGESCESVSIFLFNASMDMVICPHPESHTDNSQLKLFIYVRLCVIYKIKGSMRLPLTTCHLFKTQSLTEVNLHHLP